MVDEVKTTHQHTRSVQVEGAPERPWWATGTRSTLLGHLRPSGNMAYRSPLSDTLPPPRLAKSTTRFRHGLSTSARRNAALHAVAPRISAPRDDKEDTCTEAHTQCVWTKTGWPRLEQVYG